MANELMAARWWRNHRLGPDIEQAVPALPHPARDYRRIGRGGHFCSPGRTLVAIGICEAASAVNRPWIAVKRLGESP